MIAPVFEKAAPTAGESLEKQKLDLGFIALTDCAILVMAKERGLFAKHGLEVTLHREGSWASIRDKVSYGVLDAAQMLAPMPLAMTMGVGCVARPTIAALSLGLGGNAITLSARLAERLCEIDPLVFEKRPVRADALRVLIERDRVAGRAPLTFGIVFPVSTHTYQLRYWLAAAGIDPDHDVNLLVIPPPQMVDRLERDHIDGCCVGEPWNTLAVHRGVARVALTSQELWNNHPEKVLGMRAEWAQNHPATVRALLRALLEAAAWVDQPEHRVETAETLSRAAYVDVPTEALRLSLTGQFRYRSDRPPEQAPGFHRFFEHAALLPWQSHAVWFLTQMLRWGHLAQPVGLRDLATQVYRPASCREAAAELGMALPDADFKTEGEHQTPWRMEEAPGETLLGADRFFDGATFNPHDPLGYLARQRIHRLAAPMDILQAANA